MRVNTDVDAGYTVHVIMSSMIIQWEQVDYRGSGCKQRCARVYSLKHDGRYVGPYGNFEAQKDQQKYNNGDKPGRRYFWMMNNRFDEHIMNNEIRATSYKTTVNGWLTIKEGNQGECGRLCDPTGDTSPPVSSRNQNGTIFQIFSLSLAAHASSDFAHGLHSENSALFSCPSSSATYNGS